VRSSPRLTLRARVASAPARRVLFSRDRACDQPSVGSCVQTLQQVIADPKCVRDNGQRWIDRSARREKAAVYDVEVVNGVDAAVLVEHRIRGIGAESARAHLMSDALQRNLLAQIGGARNQLPAEHAAGAPSACAVRSPSIFPS
jgi:hypothetical protein